MKSIQKVAVVGIVAVLALVYNSCSGSEKKSRQVQLQEPLPQDKYVQVYFNQNRAAEYTEPYREITRLGDDLEQLIVDSIDSATVSVDVAVQEFRLPKIASSLVQKHQAGVRVRVILENSYNQSFSELNSGSDQRSKERYEELAHLIDGKPTENDALVILRNAGVPVIDDTADGSKGSGLMHHKFVVVDGREVVVTSANFTTSDIHGDFRYENSRGNPNNLVKVQNQQLAKLFQQEFNLMWGDGPGRKTDSVFGVKKTFRPKQWINLGTSSVAVQFGGTGARVPYEHSVNGSIGQILSRAKTSVDMALFVFSEQKISNVLHERAKVGVNVQALIERSFAHRYYSEGLDLMGVQLPNQKCKFDDNQLWAPNLAQVGVANLPHGDRLHHKFAVVDGQTVITGSHNWSAAANSSNDETLLVIHSPIVAAHFDREMQQLSDYASYGISDSLQSSLNKKLKRCQ
ncbi:phospholipase D-like domain-containing protein [Laspinema olomoucense]|uniref:phospholipase D-like domain-containing protein n=1 Tax=Laspinema olomoucense TaxID=3231600 RepID=UPI0021BBAC1F|nr:phospholipase D-like domain-containing protein [Laspinema sp. D3c]MCT7992519.1 phospholipase D-like domain-containing protein [Laspinema sp. D3c]